MSTTLKIHVAGITCKNGKPIFVGLNGQRRFQNRLGVNSFRPSPFAQKTYNFEGFLKKKSNLLMASDITGDGCR